MICEKEQIYMCSMRNLFFDKYFNFFANINIFYLYSDQFESLSKKINLSEKWNFMSENPTSIREALWYLKVTALWYHWSQPSAKTIQRQISTAQFEEEFELDPIMSRCMMSLGRFYKNISSPGLFVSWLSHFKIWHSNFDVQIHD